MEPDQLQRMRGAATTAAPNDLVADQLLTTEQAAEILNTPPATLRWWRHQGLGPKGFRLGRLKVMYKLSDVIAWREERYCADQVTAR